MTGNERYRAAETIQVDLLAASLADHGKINLRPEGVTEPSEEEDILRAELIAMVEEMGAQEPVQEAGTIDSMVAGGDELLREAAVDELAEAVGVLATDNQKDEARAAVDSDVDGGRADWRCLGAVRLLLCGFGGTFKSSVLQFGSLNVAKIVVPVWVMQSSCPCAGLV